MQVFGVAITTSAAVGFYIFCVFEDIICEKMLNTCHHKRSVLLFIGLILSFNFFKKDFLRIWEFFVIQSKNFNAVVK